MSILVHDGKQKKCISTLLTINLTYQPQISLQSSWLFLTSKKLFSMKSGQLFQCGNTIQNGDSRIQPWVDIKYNHRW
jgi:hypothetical protein